MSAPAFTPGPWVASRTEAAGDWCIHAKGTPWQLAYIPASTRIEWPLEANARLIAAAPDMLEALLKLANEVGGLIAFETEVRQAIGNTNWAVLQQRLAEADTLLSGLCKADAAISKATP